MGQEDTQRKSQLLELLKRRKHELDKQAALFGAVADPSIMLQRQDLEQQIALLELELLQLTQIPNTTDSIAEIYDLLTSVYFLQSNQYGLRGMAR